MIFTQYDPLKWAKMWSHGQHDKRKYCNSTRLIVFHTKNRISKRLESILGQNLKKWCCLVKNGQILVVFGQKRANFEFSAKKRDCHFVTVTESQVHEKNQKNLMRQFENMSKKQGFGVI